MEPEMPSLLRVHLPFAAVDVPFVKVQPEIPWHGVAPPLPGSWGGDGDRSALTYPGCRPKPRPCRRFAGGGRPDNFTSSKPTPPSAVPPACAPPNGRLRVWEEPYPGGRACPAARWGLALRSCRHLWFMRVGPKWKGGHPISPTRSSRHSRRSAIPLTGPKPDHFGPANPPAKTSLGRE